MDPGVLAITTATSTISTAAIAAAAAAKRRQHEEEEILTTYSQKELKEDWEFKILHSPKGMFKNPQLLRDALDDRQLGALVAFLYLLCATVIMTIPHWQLA